jgi:hypothetical protein
MWEAIARRSFAHGGRWRPVDGARLTIVEAREEYDAGEIEMAQRHCGTEMELLVLVRETRAPRRSWFSRMGMPDERVALLEKNEK